MEKTPSITQLAKELEELRKQVARVVEEGKQVGNDTVEEVDYELENLKEKLSRYLQAGKEKAASAAKKSQDYVDENPWKVAAAAGVIGLVVGFLASRSRD
jgi:ElaB/YqjD/DUF883 family membrane-anchored ribosome-binding protein